MGKQFQDEKADMRCVICREGDTPPGTVTVTLQRGNTVIVVRDVPAAVCQNCGEYYLDDTVANKCTSRAKKRYGDMPRWKSSVMQRVNRHAAPPSSLQG